MSEIEEAEAEMAAWNRVIELVQKHFHPDHEKARLWLITTNPMLGGLTPTWMAQRGRARKLLRIVNDMLEGNRA